MPILIIAIVFVLLNFLENPKKEMKKADKLPKH